MKLSQKSQVLLERYLLAIERKLPIQGRKELHQEIEANLMDTLEDTLNLQEAITIDQLESALRQFGSPKSVARSYRPSQTLIGPQHNAIFNFIVSFVVPIVLVVVFFSTLLSFVISGGENPFWEFWKLIGVLWNVGVGIIGTTAIVFMVLTRFFPEVNEEINLDFLDNEKNDWDINDLPELVQLEDKIQIWEPIAGIVFHTLLLVVFAFLFDQLIGFWWNTEEEWRMVPLFTEAFKAFLPMMAIGMGLNIVLNGIQLHQGKQSLFTRWFEVLINGYEISIIGMMLNAGTLMEINQPLALERGFPLDSIEDISLVFQNNHFHYFLIFLIVVITIDLVKNVIKAGKLTAEQVK